MSKIEIEFRLGLASRKPYGHQADINMEAMEWAIKNSPVRYSTILIDNAGILRQCFEQVGYLLPESSTPTPEEAK